MLPDASNNQPPTPLVAPQAALQANASPAQPAPSAGTATEQAINQAKQLVLQYQNQPFILSGALQQLKSAYLTDQFQIRNNSADS